MTVAADWRSPLPPGFRWPEGYRAAACFTFDADAESVVLIDDPEAADWLDVMSHQAYGARAGIARILRVLDRQGVRATFFIPGFTAERAPGICRAIRDAGHEIAAGGAILEAVACAVDREAVLVQELADAADQQHLVVLVIAPVAAPLPQADPNRIYTMLDKEVTSPGVIRQNMPRLTPSMKSQAKDRGVIEVVIDELGRVTFVAVRQSVHPVFDAELLSAARDWKYQPAMLAGKPVKYRKMIQINVSRQP